MLIRVPVDQQFQQTSLHQNYAKSHLGRAVGTHIANIYYLITFKSQKISQMYNNNLPYSYLTYPQNISLELTGNSKRKQSNNPKKQESYLPCQTMKIIKNKILNNVRNVDNCKSILPKQENRQQKKMQSIRVQHNQRRSRQSSGVSFLMDKVGDSNPLVTKQRSHVSQFPHDSFQRPVQKKHYQKSTVTSIDKKQPIRSNSSHPTKGLRVEKDISSNVNRQQIQNYSFKRQNQDSNIFKRGFDIGLQCTHKKKISSSKINELIGNKIIDKAIPQRRCDWSRSSFTLG